MTVILGINAYHGDSSACVIVDGNLVAAAEEERFRRIKHWAGFPSLAIESCLREAHVPLREVDHVAVNSDPRAHRLSKLWFALAQRPDPKLLVDRLRNASKRRSVASELRALDPRFRGEVHRVEHHLAHLASAFYVSPFERAICVSVDGFGDFSSAAWGLGAPSQLEVEGRVSFPHSLGIFYQALTQHLGFPQYGDEYKVMGLAPYGEPRFLGQMREIVRLLPNGAFELELRYFRHAHEKIDYAWSDGEPRVGTLFSPAASELLGPPRAQNEPLEDRHRDLARSAQAMYEAAFFHLLNALYVRYGEPRLCLAGGCAMNSVANGKVLLATPLRELYVQSAAGDAGGAIGAGMVVANAVEPRVRRGQMPHAYFGPRYADDELQALVDAESVQLSQQGCRIERFQTESELCRAVAARIASGQVIGWFQGRMEWGPRALGNRSILADPRRSDMKDLLNSKIKRRESFRPFAPSILREAVSEWFEQDADVPFMMQVFQIRKDKRGFVPAVTHVDGSGRLQTVRKEHNPRYHALIDAFRAQTGVPMLLNTSFNENEPVVCKPEEALACFLRTRMDALVLGRVVVARQLGTAE